MWWETSVLLVLVQHVAGLHRDPLSRTGLGPKQLSLGSGEGLPFETEVAGLVGGVPLGLGGYTGPQAGQAGKSPLPVPP